MKKFIFAKQAASLNKLQQIWHDIRFSQARFYRWFRYCHIAMFGCLNYFLLLVVFVDNGLFGPMPKLRDFQNPINSEATQIISEDYELLGTIYDVNRIAVDFDELSPHLIQALVAVEDKRFYEHHGIDWTSMMRVVVKTFLLGQSSGGGSTITQQTAKSMLGNSSDANIVVRAGQKLQEWILSVKLERTFTKEEIINLYFNTVDFNYEAVGIRQAATTYFSKKPSELSVEEAATLVGMLKGPSIYNPKSRPERSQKRRNVVLMKMMEAGYLNQQQYDSISERPVKVKFNPQGKYSGIGNYFRERIRRDLESWVKTHKKADGSQYDIYRDGLKVFVTINSKMQTYAEEAVQEHLTSLQKQFFKEWRGKDPWAAKNKSFIEDIIKRSKRYKQLKKDGKTDAEAMAEFKKPSEMSIFSWKGIIDTNMSSYDSLRYYKQIVQTGFMAVDPKSGYVKAWVGGADYQYFPLDHIRTKRQVGSTIKPILYSIAYQNGWLPCDAVTYGSPYPNWKPRGTGLFSEGSAVPIFLGLTYSDNIVAAQLIHEFGPSALIKKCKELGMDTEEFAAVPSIALGTVDVSVFDMVGAYTAYASGGLYSKPMYLLRIEDRFGHTLEEFQPSRKEVLTDKEVYFTLESMKNVCRYGTAARLSAYGFRNVAGKTGTTQSNTDAWFIGLTPDLVAGVWVGFDEPVVKFRSTGLGQGASAALPVWAKFFRKVYNDPQLRKKVSPGADFPVSTLLKGYMVGCGYSGDSASVSNLKVEAPTDSSGKQKPILEQ